MNAERIKPKYGKGIALTSLLILFYMFVALPLNHLINGSNFLVLSKSQITDVGIVTTNKMFGIVELKTNEKRTAYIGGFPIAMALYTDGVILEDAIHVETAFGRTTPGADFKKGDFLTELAGQKIACANDLDVVLGESNGKKLLATVFRGGEKKHLEIAPVKEEFSGKYRLGLVVRDYILGIGMVSFVKEDGSFGALGHAVADAKAGVVPIRGGYAFECEEVGIVKGEKGKSGELQVRIPSLNNPIGEIYSCDMCGVKGKFHSLENVNCEKFYAVGGRKRVSMGEAHICTTIGGETDYYKIDIIKASAQSTTGEKGMVIRVTDKRLLDKTGGIVQGMSGSPIIQNNAIVGAVTHVFINDPTKGYGIYLDFMYME